jgi:ribosomal protein L27/Tfp pilus assembly protein PilE
MLPTSRQLLVGDSAENSIMQTITIAVSAILIAAGLVTAPGLINNARDNNATSDLANVAYAQEGALAVDGKYHSDIDPKSTADDSLIKTGGVKYTFSGKTTNQAALTCDTPTAAYLIRTTAANGKTFYRASGSATTSTDLSKLTIADCIKALPGWTSFEIPQPSAGGSTTPSAGAFVVKNLANPGLRSAVASNGKIYGTLNYGAPDTTQSPDQDGNQPELPLDLRISSDNGATWSSATGLPSNQLMDNIHASADGQTIILTPGDSNGLYISHDAGASWSRVDAAGENNWNGAVTLSDDGKTIVLSSQDQNNFDYGTGQNTVVPGGAMISHDGGATFTTKNVGSGNDFHAWATSSDGSVIYGNANDGTLYKSTNGGNTFTALSTSTQGDSAISTNSDGSSVLLVDGNDRGNNLSLSTNGGQSFKNISPTNDPDNRRFWFKSDMSADGNTIVVGDGNGNPDSYISTDAGSTWTKVDGTSGQIGSVSVSADGKTFTVTDSNNRSTAVGTR